MKTPELDPKLQKIIRRTLPETVFGGWLGIATVLGITLKSVQYQLNPALGRKITYHFCGLLAVKFPVTWASIWNEYTEA